MNDNIPIIVALPSSRGWKKSERVIEDVAPLKFISGETSNRAKRFTDSDPDSGLSPRRLDLSLASVNGSDEVEQLRCGNLCMVCLENQARYKCPRCQISYCSKECYGNHTNRSDSHSCSEYFFKKKVTSLMHLESLEQEEKAHRAISRCHQNNSDQEDFQDSLEGDDGEIESLYELQSQLEILERRKKELSNKELAKLMPNSLKSLFEKDLHAGQLQAEWILRRWYPWWTRELVGGKESERGEIDCNTSDEKEKDNSSTYSRTLDEKLLRVPNYESLIGGRKNTSASMKNKNDDVLMCNLLDILYSICQTLRLYHGVENASRQAPLEAANTLISASSVLGKDTRFTTISQVLNHHCNCTAFSLVSSTINKRNAIFPEDEIASATVCDLPADWLVCVEDVCSLLDSPRMVGRALMEASDILKAAIKQLKLDLSNVETKRKESNDDEETKVKQIRRLRKKLQFFLSWVTRHPAAVDLLLRGDPKEEVLTWIQDRKQMFSEYGHDEDGSIILDENRNMLTPLKLHPSGPISTTKLSSNSSCGDRDAKLEFKTQQPLMVEIETRPKE